MNLFLAWALGCDDDTKIYLNQQDPDGNNVIGTPDDTGTPPDTYDCPTGNFLTEYYADYDGDGYYAFYDNSISGFETEICPDTAGYESTDVPIDDDLLDVDDGDASINIKYEWFEDADGDGHGNADSSVMDYEAPDGYVDSNDDADDDDATVYPGAEELCDGKDNDQDGTKDEGFAHEQRTVHTDADADGYGDPATATLSCDDVAGETEDATDCDDTNAAVNPVAAEECNGIDDDCDTLVDSDDPDAPTTTTWYCDVDGDGFADVNAWDGTYTTADYVLEQCDSPGAGWIAESNIVDVNGDGFVTADDLDADDSDITVKPDNAWYPDADGDGYGDETDDGTYANTAARAEELGVVNATQDNTDWDDADEDIYPGVTMYYDNDGDGFGDDSTAITALTDPGVDYVLNGGDWNDSNAAIYPGVTMYRDSDGDTFGDATNSASITSDPGTAYVLDATDWDDTASDIYPGCTMYYDADGDGFGDESSADVKLTDPGAGWITTGGDWDDTDSDIHPGVTMYYDDDGDGFGDDTTVITATADPGTGYVLVGGDWNDSNAAIYPGVTMYRDSDGDTFGDATNSASITSDPGTTYVLDNTDFDDTRATSYPGAPELCDGLDNDGDTAIDEGLATTTYYQDADGDGDGDVATAEAVCDISFSTLTNPVTNSDDMDDTDATLNSRTDFYVDADGDGYGSDSAAASHFTTLAAASGYVTDNTDCNDTNDTAYPGASDIFDFAVNDCNSTDTNEGTFELGSATHDVISGTAATTNLGVQTTWIGDVDNDGTNDLFVGSLSYSSTGAEFLVLGEDLTSGANIDVTTDVYATVTGTVTSGQLAFAHPSEDFDLDGNPDYIIYSPYITSNTGAVYLFSGSSTGSFTPTSASASVVGSATNQYVGYAVESGDLDGSTTPDLVVAEAGYSSLKGAVLIYNDLVSGSQTTATADATLIGATTSDLFGADLALDDYDGDGNPDLLISAYGFDGTAGTNTGIIYFVTNGSLPTTATATAVSTLSTLSIEGTIAQEEIGREIRFVPDMDGDGRPEILVGAARADLVSSGSQEGLAHLFLSGTLGTSGSYDSSDADYSFEGVDTNDQAGTIAAGDIDADGIGDIAVGANEADITGTRSGNVCVFNGAILLTLPSATYSYNYDTLGITCFPGASGSGAGYSLDMTDGALVVGGIYANSSAGGATVVHYEQ